MLPRCDEAPKNFKFVNDRFVHQRVNQILRLLAGAIKSNTRSTDIVARMGGDEFAILNAGDGRTESTPGAGTSEKPIGQGLTGRRISR